MVKQICMILVSTVVVQTVSVAYYPAEAPILSIEEATAPARLQQAREIFGRRSSATAVVKTTIEKENLAEFIIAKLENELPKQYKSQAESLTATLLSTSAIHGLDPLLVLAVMRQESTFRPDAMGRNGEIGLMQLKPETARWIANRVGIYWNESDSLFDPHFNIRIGTAYLSFLRERFNGEGRHYLAAYNLGPAAARNKLKNDELPSTYSRSLSQHYASMYRRWIEFDSRIIAMTK
jgi:soluble lytic murein transglycosylase